MEGISKQAGQFDAGNGDLEGMKHATLLDLNDSCVTIFKRSSKELTLLYLSFPPFVFAKCFLAHSIFASSILRSCREESLALVSAIK